MKTSVMMKQNIDYANINTQ